MMTLEEQIRELRRLREHYEYCQRKADEAKSDYDMAHMELWDRMDGTGVSSVKIDGRQYVLNPPKPYASISDRRLFVEWALENAPELVDYDARKGLVNELVRQRIDNNEELPPGVNWYTRRTVAQRQG